MKTTRAVSLALLSAVWISLPAAPARAQAKPQSGEFSVQSFEPAPGTRNFLSVETARMTGAWGFSAGFLFNYARNPLVVVSCVSKTNCDKATSRTDVHVVENLATWDLLLAVSPIERLQIGLRLPVVYLNGNGFEPDNGYATPGGIAKAGVGDPTLEAKVRILGKARDPFVLGAAADLSFPVGHAFSTDTTQYYMGNSSPLTGGVRAIADAQLGPIQLALNLRGVFRAPAELGTTKVGPVDLRYGAGLGYRVSPNLRFLAEGFGSTQFSLDNGTNTLEVDGAVEVAMLAQRLVLRVGGGAGVLQGVGVPAARGFLGVAFVREIGDQDGDGIEDTVDKCPTIPEDRDGFEDDDGCPDPDNDGDKIPDAQDRCPNMPETVNGYQDDDGCPDELPDRDGDGIPDADDKCPDQGGKDVIRTAGSRLLGCPDRDHDNIPDHLDKCPDAAEDFDGFQDEDGCPDLDNDGDGIPDELDECPDQPETYNGFKDQDGCPDTAPGKAPALVQMAGDEIKILERVEFASGKDVIQGGKSFKVLDMVAEVLSVRREITLVEVGGHTDNAGKAEDNRKLSQKRAEAVVKYLVKKKVDPSRLVAKGYGPDKPIADNKSIAGMQANRRVEFRIQQRATPAAPAAPAAK